MPARRLAAIFGVLAGGCSQLVTQNVRTSTYVRTEQRMTVVDLPATIMATGRLEGTDLVVHAETARECRVSDVPIYRVHYRRVLRNIDGTSGVTSVGFELGIGALLGLATLGLVVEGRNGCPYTLSITVPSPELRDPCYDLAAVAGVAGAAMLGRGVVDMFLPRDIDDGEREEAAPLVNTRNERCEIGPVRSTRVVISLGDLQRETVMSPVGEAKLSLLEASERALDAAPRLALDGHRVSIRVDAGFAGAAKAALAARPESRLARERRDARDQLVTEVEEALAANDVVRARTLVERNGEAVAVIGQRSNVRPTLRRILAEASVAILSGKAAAANVSRFCAARSILIVLDGEPGWRAVIRELGTDGAELYGGTAAAIQARLEAGCGRR